MTARPLKYHQRGGLIALFGQPEPRDGYIGEFLAPVVEHREPIRTIHMRRTGNAVLLAVADADNVLTTITVCALDDPRLQAFPVAERNRVYSALSAIQREGGPADANP